MTALWTRGLEGRLGDFRRDRFYAETDLPGGGSWAGAYPWAVSPLASGSMAASSEADHPGVQTTSASASANSGTCIWLAQYYGFTFAEGLRTEVIFKPKSFTNAVHVLGFANVLTAVTPTNGLYGSIAPTTGILTGVSMASSVATSTPTGYALTPDTWYRLVVEAQTASVSFRLYDEDGLLLWSDGVFSGLPGAGEVFGSLLMSYSPSGGVQELMAWDWIAVGREGLRR